MPNFVINDEQPMRGTLIDVIRVFRKYINHPTNTLIGTKSGSVVTADDAFPAFSKAVTVYGKSVQDGTPTPDAPVEIVSVDGCVLNITGKNLLNIVDTKGVTADGNVITVSGTWRDLFTGTVGLNAVVEDLSEVPRLNAGTYTISTTKESGAQFRLFSVSKQGVVSSIYSPAATSTRFMKTFTLEEPTYITIRAVSTTLTDLQLEYGDTATDYNPYTGQSVQLLDQPLRSLPDGTKDLLSLTYAETSTLEGYAWYSRKLIHYIGETTTAETDGITGTIGVNVLSTTGEIADGPIVTYKLTTPTTTTLDPIELPILPAPNFTLFANGGNVQPDVRISYERDITIAVDRLEAAETPSNTLSISPTITHNIEPSIQQQEETE